jgi:hypothetical protein
MIDGKMDGYCGFLGKYASLSTLSTLASETLILFIQRTAFRNTRTPLLPLNVARNNFNQSSPFSQNLQQSV